jgi:hypothetical protein
MTIESVKEHSKRARPIARRSGADGGDYGPVFAAKPPHICDAAALMRTPLMPVRYVIPGWLPEGLTLLVANPKVGKSTLILQAAVALAGGGVFWGEDVPQGKALMIDLETNERRLRRKLVDAGASELPDGALMYSTDWPKGAAGVDAIAELLDSNPEIRLVVIDTLQRFRDSSAGAGRSAYAADYDALAPLQKMCRDRPGLAVVAVHHKRKAASDDPIDSINGSAAIAGAADGIWILSRKGSEFTLHVQARDWEREEDEFRLERLDGCWQLSGAPRYSSSESEVLSLLDKTGPLTTAAAADALTISRQAALKRLQRMQGTGLIEFREGAWRSIR